MTAALHGTAGELLGPGGRPLTDEQANAVRRRSGRLLLSANAGSGKTTVLAERFARAVVEDQIAPGRLLAITFTDKAAGELRARLRGRLVELGARDAAREMDAAWVSTIHGFCARILRGHAIAAGLDPRFTVLDEATARAMRSRAWDAALAAFLDVEGDGRAAALAVVAAHGPDPLREAIEAIHGELRSQGQTAPVLPPARPRVTPRAAHERLVAAQRALAAELEGVTRSLKSLDEGRAVVARAAELLEAGALTLDRLAELSLKRGCTELKTAAADAFREAVQDAERAAVDAEAASQWQLLGALLDAYATRYAEAKRALSALDYDDLELALHELFGAQPALAAAYAERFERVMVDEFQDTNPLQLAILGRLRGDAVFVVGDELQSIYGFRHADVGLFRTARAAHEATGDAASLTTNWRARPELLHTVNAWLGPMHARYARLVPGRADPPDPAGPRTELLLVDEAWNDPDVDEVLAEQVRAGMPSGTLARQAEARAIARRVRELLTTDGAAPGDVAVLLRAATDLQLFERAFELEELPTLASGGRGFWGRQEVQDLTAYLAVLANPRDELALYSALASPLCGLSSDALARIAQLRATGQLAAAGTVPPALAAALGPADRVRLTAFLERLSAERPRAPRRGLDELVHRIVEAAGYDLHVLRLAGGRRRLANIHKLERLAAAYEARHGRDLRGFIDHARTEAEAEAREPEAPIDPGDRSAVALMTIHAAKGLEFGIVVVADLGRRRVARFGRILVDGDRAGLRLVRAGEDNLSALDYDDLRAAAQARELEEERRILHVAVTRAEERLILSATVPIGEDAQWPAPSATAPPIATIGPLLDPGLLARLAADPVVDLDERREDDALRVRVRRVGVQDAPDRLGIDAGPGQLAMALDGGAVLGPVATSSDDVPAGGAPHVATVPTHLSYSQISAYERCAYRVYLERELGLPPVVGDLVDAAQPAVAGLDPLVRGSLVHELLEELDLADPAPLGDEILDAHAERYGAELDDAARDDVRRLVAAFTTSALHDRLAAAGEVQREAVFAFALGDTMLTGVVDARAREADGTALIIDYKTDRADPDEDLEAHVERDYAVQRRIYALAELRAGAPAVEVVHHFLERADGLVTVRYTAQDAPVLEAELRERMAGVLSGAHPVAAEPHRGLCRGCPGRGTLCSQPVELTERARG